MRLAILTDPHLVSDPHDGRDLRFHNVYETESGPLIVSAAVAAAVEADVDVIVLLGDLANDGDREQLTAVVSLAAGSGLPVWAVPGNHDAILGEGSLREAVGDVGVDAVRFLDGTAMERDGFRVVGVPVTTRDGGETASAIASLSLGEDDDEPLLVVSHCPLLSFAREVVAAGFPYAGDLGELETVAAPLLARRSPVVVISGHLHARLERAQGPVLQLVASALTEEPHEIAIVELEWNGSACSVHRRTVRVHAGSGGPAPLLAPARAGWIGTTDGWRATE